MMDLLLDMSSRMEAMEEFMSQHNVPHLMGNLGLIPEGSSDLAQHDGAVGSISTCVVAGHLESSLTITLREAEGHVPEMRRRRMGRYHSSSADRETLR